MVLCVTQQNRAARLRGVRTNCDGGDLRDFANILIGLHDALDAGYRELGLDFDGGSWRCGHRLLHLHWWRDSHHWGSFGVELRFEKRRRRVVVLEKARGPTGHIVKAGLKGRHVLLGYATRTRA
jgi:hypothetical protein